MHLRITNKCSYIKFTYSLDRSIIKEVSSAYYLGITINSKLTWSDIVTRVVAKANSARTSQPGFLQRNLKYCPPEIKASCFKSLVIPTLEYGALYGFPIPKDTFMSQKWFNGEQQNLFLMIILTTLVYQSTEYFKLANPPKL